MRVTFYDYSTLRNHKLIWECPNWKHPHLPRVGETVELGGGWTVHAVLWEIHEPSGEFPYPSVEIRLK